MMRCIRVPKKNGEGIRSELMASGLLNLDARIRSDGDCILIPINCDSYKDLEVVDADLEAIEHKVSDYRDLAQVPSELKGALPTSHDVIGDLLILKLPDELLPYKRTIGEALMKTTPNIRSVFLDGGVKGDFRIRDLELIVGDGSTETIHREFGTRMLTDPTKVYFNPRLSSERHRTAMKVRPGEVIIDMFAGVAPFGTVICKCAEPKIVYSIDLNPDAEYFVRRNMEMNHIDNIVPLTGDATVVIRDLPMADRIVMNLPQMADRFILDALSKLKEGGIAHMHRILERAELEHFREELVQRANTNGYEISIANVCELKTYSPTQSVYVFDVRLDQRLGSSVTPV